MKMDLLTVKELAAELRMSPKSIQRAYAVESEKRANGGTSETSETRGDGWSGAMNQSNERPDAWRVRLKKDEGQPMRLRRFSRQPGLLRGLLHRLSLAGER
jgi:hypothetical protein